MLTETKSVAAYDFYQFFMFLDMNQIIEKNKISIRWQEKSEDSHSQMGLCGPGMSILYDDYATNSHQVIKMPASVTLRLYGIGTRHKKMSCWVTFWLKKWFSPLYGWKESYVSEASHPVINPSVSLFDWKLNCSVPAALKRQVRLVHCWLLSVRLL